MARLTHGFKPNPPGREAQKGPYGIRTRAAAVRGRCPRPLDEWAVRRGSVPNLAAIAPTLRACLPRCRDRRAVSIAAVDPGLEAAADVLARREKCVVAHTARGQLDDAHRLVPVAVAARVGGRLIEGLQAITLPPKPCHTRTPTTSRPPWEPGRAAGFRTLQTKRGGEGLPRASARACRTTGSSRDPTRRSTGGRH